MMRKEEDEREKRNKEKEEKMKLEGKKELKSETGIGQDDTK